MDDVTTDLEAAAELYASLGWRMIPLYGVVRPGVCSCPKSADCPSPGKHPIAKKWQESATNDMSRILQFIDSRGSTNLGVLLGEKSGIIDVECDSPEAEQELGKLLGDGEDAPVCPTFSSGRGKHRIFRWTSEVPATKAVIKYRGIEFRVGGGGRGAQSVFPPSSHHSGQSYAWLPGLSPDDVEPPPLPALALGHLVSLDCEGDAGSGGHPGKAANWGIIRDGDRNDEIIRRCGILQAKGMPDEAIRAAAHGFKYESRPAEKDIDERVDYILGKPKGVNLDGEDDEADSSPELKNPSAWRVVRVRGAEPPQWEFYAPQFEGRYVVVYDDITKPILRRAILKQLNRLMPPGWWNHLFGNSRSKDPAEREGILPGLLRQDEMREGTSSEKRMAIVADYLWDEIQSAEERDEFRSDERKTVQTSDGKIWFRFRHLHNRLGFGADPVKPTELAEVLKIAGVEEKVVRCGARSRYLFNFLPPDAVSRVRDIALNGRKFESLRANSEESTEDGAPF